MMSATAAALRDPVPHVYGLSAEPGGLIATPLQVLRFVADAVQQGQRAALVTITGLTGSSSRPVGTLMGVAEDGNFAGSFSGGCIEAAVVAEAQDAIEEGRCRQVRYGAGSPYLDIRLPCGGGVDLLFQPVHHSDAIDQAVLLLERRVSISLIQNASGDLKVVANEGPRSARWQGEAFISWYAPPLKIIILGHGMECVALAHLGQTYGASVTVMSPDERIVAHAEQLGACARPLTTPDLLPQFNADPWSAFVFLFHDHAWEPSLLKQALAQPAFFVGAMGSRRTHAHRLEVLREHGVTEEALARIVAPLGLIPSARDPATLALSALAQVADRYRQAIAPPSIFKDTERLE